MPIKTTMYIHDTTLALINDACALAVTGRNDMIRLFLRNAMTDQKWRALTGQLVRYQERDRRERWHTVHVRFREDEMDYFKDLRGFFRMSVSLILALAARDYLNGMIRKSRVRGERDNYHFVNYTIRREVIDGIYVWRIYWGYARGYG